MKAIEKLQEHPIWVDMDDIIREGNPTLRAVGEDVTFPLSDQEIILGEKMMQFLHHSQDPVAEKLGLPWRSGTLLLLSWTSRNALSLFWCPIQKMPMATTKEAYSLQEVMYNQRLLPILCTRCGTCGDGRLSLWTATSQAMWFDMPAWRLSISQKMGKRNASNSWATTPSSFNMKSTTPTASCSMTASSQTTHLKSKKAFWY